MDRSPAVKKIAGDAAWIAGLAPRAARGAWHTARDIGRALNFGSRLFDPTDAEFSPPGEAAWDKVVDFGKGVIDYTGSAVSNPTKVAHDFSAGRSWHGSPPALKAVGGAGVVGAGAAVDQASNGQGAR
jgi:hypothetical protein